MLDGLTHEQRVDKTRTIFERILRDERLSEFEPEAATNGEFSARFLGCSFDGFNCALMVVGPQRVFVKAEYCLGGRLMQPMAITCDDGLDLFVRSMARRVRRFVRRRAARVSGTIRDHRIEIWDVILNHEALGVVRVKKYRYGVASWDSVVSQRGAPTVHVLANGEHGEVLESGVATLVFTWAQAEEAIWKTCRIRLDTMRFMMDVELLLDP